MLHNMLLDFKFINVNRILNEVFLALAQLQSHLSSVGRNSADLGQFRLNCYFKTLTLRSCKPMSINQSINQILFV